MNKDLCMEADVVVPVNISKIIETLSPTTLDDGLDLINFIPDDVIKFYEDNIPSPESGFCKLDDAKVVEAIDDGIFTKYAKDKNYIYIDVKMYFSIKTKKVIQIITEPPPEDILLN